MEKYQFMIWYSAFAFFIIQVGSLAGASLLDVGLTPPSFPYYGDDIISGIFTAVTIPIFVASNIAFFFTLMSLNSSFWLFGTLVLTPLGIGLLWILIEAFNPVG